MINYPNLIGGCIYFKYPDISYEKLGEIEHKLSDEFDVVKSYIRRVGRDKIALELIFKYLGTKEDFNLKTHTLLNRIQHYSEQKYINHDLHGNIYFIKDIPLTI